MWDFSLPCIFFFVNHIVYRYYIRRAKWCFLFFIFILFHWTYPKKNHKRQHLVLRIGNCRLEQAPCHTLILDLKIRAQNVFYPWYVSLTFERLPICYCLRWYSTLLYLHVSTVCVWKYFQIWFCLCFPAFQTIQKVFLHSQLSLINCTSFSMLFAKKSWKRVF
jgi:hypothetical protein